MTSTPAKAHRPHGQARSKPRTRVSRRRYVARRAGALAILVVVLLLGAQVAIWAAGAAGTETASGAVVDAAAPSESSSATAALSTDPPGTGTEVGVDVNAGAVPVPTAATPARLAVYGDSHAGGFGPYLEEMLDDLGIVETTLTYKVSSGLVRDDFYDWPAELPAIVAADQPAIAVVAWGGNDGQGMTIDGKAYALTSDTWAEVYSARVTKMLDILTGAGARVIWVGLANAPDAEFSSRLEVVRDVTRAAVEAYPVPIAYVDTWARFTGVDGGYAEYVIDPRDGQGKDVRASDGNHLNPTGAEILSLDIVEAVKVELRALGANI